MNEPPLDETRRVSQKLRSTKGYYPDIDSYHENELLAFFDARNKAYHSERQRRIASIDTREKLDAYIGKTRKAFAGCLGSLPPREASGAKIVGTLDKGEYLVDKVLIESLPGYYLTANFYYPARVSGRLPAVLFLCGHTADGKAGDLYVAFCVEAVSSGFCVLTFDPVGQGERKMYGARDGEMFARESAAPDVVHVVLGRQMSLVGDTITRFMMSDNIRALDYLCDRQEVDRDRIAVTGNSGGGHMSAFMGACDPRLAAVAPCCYMTELYPMISHVGSQEDEQSLPGFMKLGLDLPDLIALAAPKPYYIGASLLDFFPIHGTRDAYAEARRVYRLLDNEENIEIYVAPKPHGFWSDQREHVLEFLCRRLAVELVRDKVIDYSRLPSEAELACLENGDVSTLDSMTLQQVAARKAGEQSAARGRRHDAPRARPYAETLKAEVMEALGIDLEALRSDIVEERTLPAPAEGVRAKDLSIVSESGMKVYATFYEGRVAEGGPKPLLVHAGALVEDDRPAALPVLLETYSSVLCIETRGTGRGKVPPGCFFFGADSLDNEEERYNCNAEMLGRSVLGMRVMDVLAGLRIARGLAGPARLSLVLYGYGENAIVALHAALLGEVSDVRLEALLSSYEAIVDNRAYAWSPSALAHGILVRYDIPELVAALLPGRVTIEGLVDHMKKKIDGRATDAFRTRVHDLTGSRDERWEVTVR